MRPYWVVVNGQRFQVLASERDAQARGLMPVEPTETKPAAVKQQRVPNKARTAANK